MQRQLKAGPFHIKAISGREVTGIFSVLGNLDDYDDRIWQGSFAKTFQERGSKVLHLWQHDFCSPPIAVIKSLREVGRDELPPAVLAAAPDALGGAEVVREYLPTPRGDEVLAALSAGSPLQMSFAYDAIRWDYEAKPDAKYEWERVRNIREIRLWETSDVLWGANSATVASKAAFPFEFLLKQLSIHLDELKADPATKESRRNSTADQDRIETIARLAVELGATNVVMIGDSSEGEPDEDSAKSREPSSRAAELASALTALAYRNRLELAQRALQLANVR